MKSKRQKRLEAMARIAESKFEDSKAFRKGTKTEAQWGEWKSKHLDHLALIK